MGDMNNDLLQNTWTSCGAFHSKFEVEHDTRRVELSFMIQ